MRLRFILFYIFQHNFCVKPYVPREPRRDPSNRRLNEHGIYIRHCQESNSQPVPSQAGADPTRPQWRTFISVVCIKIAIWWYILASLYIWCMVKQFYSVEKKTKYIFYYVCINYRLLTSNLLFFVRRCDDGGTVDVARERSWANDGVLRRQSRNVGDGFKTTAIVVRVPWVGGTCLKV